MIQAFLKHPTIAAIEETQSIIYGKKPVSQEQPQLEQLPESNSPKLAAQNVQQQEITLLKEQRDNSQKIDTTKKLIQPNFIRAESINLNGSQLMDLLKQQAGANIDKDDFKNEQEESKSVGEIAAQKNTNHKVKIEKKELKTEGEEQPSEEIKQSNEPSQGKSLKFPEATGDKDLEEDISIQKARELSDFVRLEKEEDTHSFQGPFIIRNMKEQKNMIQNIQSENRLSGRDTEACKVCVIF